MSPVEMAKAFGAPIMAGAAGSNNTAEEIAESKGAKTVVVRYGETVNGDGGEGMGPTPGGGVRLRFVDAGRAADPVSERVYE